MINLMALSDKRRTKQLTIAILLIGVLFFAYSMFAVYASGLGGYISEKLIANSGTTNSALVIDRYGVSNSNLDVVMGPVVTTLTPINIYIDGTGSHATLKGNLASLNGFPASNVWFEWGYSPAYGNTTPTQTATTIGVYTATIDHYIATNQIYYRFVGQADGTNYSSGTSFLLTDGGGSGAAVPLLPIIVLVFVAAIIIFMMVATRTVENPMFLIIILGILILMGLALASGLQGIINSLF